MTSLEIAPFDIAAVLALQNISSAHAGFASKQIVLINYFPPVPVEQLVHDLMQQLYHGLTAWRLAEGVGFEPTEPLGSAVFKTAGINHSPTLPCATIYMFGWPPSISKKPGD